MSAGLAESYLRVRAALDSIAADPLAHFRFGVPRLRQALALFSEGMKEGHLRACNKGGKTLSAAAYVLACCQKRRHLDGCPIPQWRGPVEAAQLTLDYPQQVLSVRPAYMRLLGNWPHHAVPQTSGAPLERLSVMPVGGDPSDERDWSVIHFLSQKNMQSGKGVRADVVAFDEPPIMDILNELRKAPHAGRPGIRLIAETPIKRREWAPLREDYGDTPRRAIRKVDDYRFEVRWSLDDVADWVLSAEEKAELRAMYARQPALADAREHGDYANTDGACPFDITTLLQMLEGCREPEFEDFRIPIEAPDGKPVPTIEATVQVYAKPTGKQCRLSIDPASGVDDGRHNPAAFLLSEIGSGDLLVRWNGRIPPFSVGVLAATIGRQYGNTIIDVETNDHWGVNVYRGLEKARYGNLAHENRILRPDVWAKEAGWRANEESRAVAIGCVQEWIAAYAAGVPYAACPSKEVLETLMECVLDERGKIVAAPGIDHGEDLVLWGRNLSKCVKRSNLEIPRMYKPPETDAERLVRRIKGLGQPKRPSGVILQQPRQPKW